MWRPTVQFTCKIFDPKSQETTWKSLNVTNFATPPPPNSLRTFDKRSSKSDQFTVFHKETPSDAQYSESYDISANLGDDLQISLTVSRPKGVPGFKLGRSPRGGFSYFGKDIENPDGYVVHRFWPRTHCTGHIIRKGKAIEANGAGMFVHAIQGMRPNLVAARWNFADFQSDELGGTSAIQMEFTTTDAYGHKGSGSGGVRVNVGCIVIAGKLVAVTGETVWSDQPVSQDATVKSRTVHLQPEHDPDTGYNAPTNLHFEWAGPSVSSIAKGNVKAVLDVDVGGRAAPKGLVEKVDVLAEIPFVLKAFVNYVAGTKPYIYQVGSLTILCISWS
jgi:Svf1-like C-terminal lipocalin-like domain/Svf1-like N-terminal lipocalin domain